MADLDALYHAWWSSCGPVEEQRRTHAAMLKGVLDHAQRRLRDYDQASDVLVVVLEKLERFVRSDEGAFSRWVNSIIKRVRLSGWKRKSTDVDRGSDADPDAVLTSDDTYFDFGAIPDDLHVVAALALQGYSLRDIARELGTTPNAIYQKMWRERKKSSCSNHFLVET